MVAIDWTEIQKKYPGKWVGFAHDEITILAVGDSPQEGIEKAKKKTDESPVLMHMPIEDIAYVGYGL